MNLRRDGWWCWPALGGLLVGVSYLPGPFLPLSLAGFVPMLAWFEDHPAASGYERFRAGLVFGWVVHLISMHWQYSMLSFSWLAVLLYLASSLGLGLRIALSLMLAGWLRRRTRLSWGLLLPLVWLPAEWLQSFGDLRMTGEHLYHTVAGYPFVIQFADLFGPYGVGAVLLAVNGLIFEVARARRHAAGRRAAWLLLVLLAAVLAYDTWAWVRPDPPRRTVRVGLVQPDIPLAVKHDPERYTAQWDTLVELTERAAAQGAEVVIWPESARPWPLVHRLDRPETYAMHDVSRLATRLGIDLIVGVEYYRVRGQDDYESYNAAFAVDAGGAILAGWGAKVFLVPFVEQTPFRGVFGPLIEGRGGEWRWLAGGFTAGADSALFEMAGTRFGVLVCYEQLFADLARRLRNRGAEVSVVITNDAWFGRSLFQSYQANALRLRAIENRTGFVRVANTGISGFVDARGRYAAMTGLFEQRVEVRDVVVAGPRTVFDRLGNLVAWLAATGLLTLILLARRGVRSHISTLRHVENVEM